MNCEHSHSDTTYRYEMVRTPETGGTGYVYYAVNYKCGLITSAYSTPEKAAKEMERMLKKENPELLATNP